jgi:thiol:disulfide interchange protein DsbA
VIIPRCAAVLRAFACFLALACFAQGSVLAQDAPAARLGTEYRLIDPQPVQKDGRIEVIEFFWYGCPFCYEMQPALEDWVRSMPQDVVLRRVPAILRDAWAPHVRIFYALEALGELDRLHQQVYHGYHVEELHMSKPDAVAQWAARHGIAREKWLAVYDSADVTQKVERARELTRIYEVRGTPTVIVDGRYLTSSSMVGSVRGVMPVVDQLIRMTRAKRTAK